MSGRTGALDDSEIQTEMNKMVREGVRIGAVTAENELTPNR